MNIEKEYQLHRLAECIRRQLYQFTIGSSWAGTIGVINIIEDCGTKHSYTLRRPYRHIDILELAKKAEKVYEFILVPIWMHLQTSAHLRKMRKYKTERFRK